MTTGVRRRLSVQPDLAPCRPGLKGSAGRREQSPEPFICSRGAEHHLSKLSVFKEAGAKAEVELGWFINRSARLFLSLSAPPLMWMRRLGPKARTRVLLGLRHPRVTEASDPEVCRRSVTGVTEPNPILLFFEAILTALQSEGLLTHWLLWRFCFCHGGGWYSSRGY